MEILAKILEVINNKISLPVAIFCAILLFLPDSVIETMTISNFISTNKDIIWLFFLFSTILYLYEKTNNIISEWQKKRKINKENITSQKYVQDVLESLSNQEKAWIYYCLRENVDTLVATSINSTAISLENKRIVKRPSTPYDILATPFTFNKIFWGYLKENKDTYCSEADIEDNGYNRDIDRFIDGLRSVV